MIKVRTRTRSREVSIKLLLICSLFCGSYFSGNAQKFVAIGDYGTNDTNEAKVAVLVKSLNPEFIITLGDNNYPSGAASTIDQNIGQYYQEFIFPYTGIYGLGDSVNRFYPAIGNHDALSLSAQPYLDYFTLPGIERYYEIVKGDVHLFSINSDLTEPDGIDSNSVQALWLKAQLAASSSKWKIVYFHHSAYSSGATHGSTLIMRWPFQTWGATAVIGGHDHVYERIMIDGFPYFVNGLGGRYLYNFSTIITGSTVRYNGDFGAMLIEAFPDSIIFRFINTENEIKDCFAIGATGMCPFTSLSDLPDLDVHRLTIIPNPVMRIADIEYKVADHSIITLCIYDAKGAVIDTLVNNARHDPGSYKVQFDSSDVEAGIYFCTIFEDSRKSSTKFIVAEK